MTFSMRFTAGTLLSFTALNLALLPHQAPPHPTPGKDTESLSNGEGSTHSSDLKTSFEVIEIDPPIDFLESEVKPQGITKTTHRFMVKNKSHTVPLHVSDYRISFDVNR